MPEIEEELHPVAPEFAETPEPDLADIDIDDIETLPPDPDEMPVRRILNTPYHYLYGALAGYGIGMIGTGLFGVLGLITEEMANNGGSMASWALALAGACIGHFIFKKEEKEWKAKREAEKATQNA